MQDQLMEKMEESFTNMVERISYLEKTMNAIQDRIMEGMYYCCWYLAIHC